MPVSVYKNNSNEIIAEPSDWNSYTDDAYLWTYEHLNGLLDDVILEQ